MKDDDVCRKKKQHKQNKKKTSTRRRSTDGMQLAQVHRDFYYFLFLHYIYGDDDRGRACVG